jgi:hypothetical protein
MEPRFRIVGNEVKEQIREKEPSMPVEFDELMERGEFMRYEKRLAEYNEHLSSLRTYIASPELKTTFGDNEFREKDFVMGCDFPICNCPIGLNESYQCRLVAYPVSQEQESQEDLWEEAEMKLRQRLYKKFTGADKSTMNLMAKDFTDALKQHYTITKNK